MKSQTPTLKVSQRYPLLVLFVLFSLLLPDRSSGGKAYPLGCASKLPSYYDYDENYVWPPPTELCRASQQYWLLKRLGNGKFSDVFEALEKERGGERASFKDKDKDSIERLVVIKCLKPVAPRKVRREILVLTRAANLPNMVRLLGVVTNYQGVDCDNLDPKAKIKKQERKAQPYMPALVMEHAGLDSRWLCHGIGKDDFSAKYNMNTRSDDNKNVQDNQYLTLYEIKYFLFHLLIALDSLHGRGIMHRDVKPRNVLIVRGKRTSNPSGTSFYLDNDNASKLSRRLMLIDLGLADFYLPGTPYNVRVASRHYKAPELLVGDELYDYAVDLWGVGCILAGLLFRKEPFFRGRDNVDQLLKIACVLGTDDLISYFCQKRNIPFTQEIDQALFPRQQQITSQPLPQGQRKSWIPFIPKGIPFDKNYRQGLDLLDKLLVYDHERRLNAREAMGHVFFDEVREEIKKEVIGQSNNSAI